MKIPATLALLTRARKMLELDWLVLQPVEMS